MLPAMRFEHVGILVDDIDAAVAFARDVLGLGEPDAGHGPRGSGVRETTGLAPCFVPQ
jgi:catechol 2,3-dioxygenase-like lactoylglutathione lyase family enzyme